MVVGRERPLTDAALVTALCVGDLSCQGKPPEERKQSSCCDRSLKRADDVYNKGSQPELLFFFLPLQQSVMMLDSDSKKTAQRECSNIRKVVTLSQNKIKQKKDSRACWSHLGKILSGKR